MVACCPTTLDSLAEKAGELYTLPRVAAQVLELTRQPTIDTWKLKECIENDPALTAKLLRVVNSSLFGLSRSVADLNQALAILGTKPLKLLVLGFSLPEGLFQEIDPEPLSRYWQQSLVKAVAARELSNCVSRVSEDEAFIAALLQDIGALALLQHLGEPYLALLKEAQRQQGDVLHLERLTLGFDRTQLTSRLMNQWQLPAAIVDAAQLPHSPDEALEEACKGPLRYVVYLADLLTRVVLEAKTEALQELLEAARIGAKLDETRLARLVDELQAKVPQLADVLSLSLPGGLNAPELLAQAYAQLKPIAGEAAAELIASRRQLALARAEELSRTEASQALRRRLETPPAEVPAETAAPVRPGAELPKVATSRSVPRTAAAARLPADAYERLVGRLGPAIARCRQQRAPLALMLVQFDSRQPSDDPHASETGELLGKLLSACRALDSSANCLPLGSSCMAVLMESYDRQQAVQLGQQLLRMWRRITEAPPAAGTSISAGLAALACPSLNFPAEALVSRAADCLSGAQSSGGNCLKSVEL